MDSLLNDPQPQGIGTGVHPDGRADLVDGEAVNIVPLGMQCFQHMLAVVLPFLYVIAIAD